MSASTTIAGIVIPSTSRAFLAGVGLHVAVALAAVAGGAGAILSRKGGGRHRALGRLYFWSLGAVAATALALAAARWSEDNHLAALAVTAFASAAIGRRGVRSGQVRLHIVGMGASYVLMLTAFYVDNGRFLPVWRDLHPAVYWLAPGVVGLPLIAWALWRHPLAKSSPS